MFISPFPLLTFARVLPANVRFHLIIAYATEKGCRFTPGTDVFLSTVSAGINIYVILDINRNLCYNIANEVCIQSKYVFANIKRGDEIIIIFVFILKNIEEREYIMKFKKTIAMWSAIIMSILAMNSNVLAADITSDVNYTIENSGYSEQLSEGSLDLQIDTESEQTNDYISIPIIDSSENLDDNNQTLSDDDVYEYEENSPRYSYRTSVGYALIRNGNTTTCQLYIYWTGNATLSGFGFDKISVVASNSTYEYSYISGSWVPTETAAKQGNVYVADVWVPTDVDEVRVGDYNLTAYCMEAATTMLLGTNRYQSVDIN